MRQGKYQVLENREVSLMQVSGGKLKQKDVKNEEWSG
jgi:hypothetical protein